MSPTLGGSSPTEAPLSDPVLPTSPGPLSPPSADAVAVSSAAADGEAAAVAVSSAAADGEAAAVAVSSAAEGGEAAELGVAVEAAGLGAAAAE